LADIGAPCFGFNAVWAINGKDSTQQGVSKMVTHLHVRARNENLVGCRLHLGERIFPCRIGRAGRTHRKKEGDGKTPIGGFWLRQGFYRADRLAKAVRGKLRVLRPIDGWCEQPHSQFYNRHVALPFRDAHETMWREDEAYDIVFATSHNERPRIRGGGSAIFFHLTRQGSVVTAGCVAVSKSDMVKILSACGNKVKLWVWPGQGCL
jgi:L,D-peptidoglycan transpeptidase YkuD (ErfK/YbiS/YcfS/YnhG family)